MLLLRRGRDTIRRKRGMFSLIGENGDQQATPRLCVRAPTSSFVCCSAFVLLASKTNHAFNVGQDSEKSQNRSKMGVVIP